MRPPLWEIRPNLWICELTAPGLAVRAVLIQGEKRAAIWDTLTRPEDAAPIAEAIAGRAHYVVYSHADYDHCWGTAALAEGRLGVIGHQECRRRFGDDAPRALERMQMADFDAWASVRLVPPNVAFATRLALDLGGVTLELHHLPGHTADSIVGWIPEWGVFLGGDAIETPLPVVNSARLLDGWLLALEEWRSIDGLTLSIPAHGSLNGRESLDSTAAYLRELAGGRQFQLPRKLDDFYRETHQKNLIIVDGALDLHE